MRKKLFFGFLGVVLMVSIILAGCAAPSPKGEGTTTPPVPEESEVIKWTMQNNISRTPVFGPYKDYVYQSCIFFGWVDWLEEASNGLLEIDVVEPGSVFPVTEGLAAIGSGVADCSFTPSGYWAGTIPEMYIVGGLPGGWPTTHSFLDALYVYGMYDKVKGLYDDYNVVWFPSPQLEIMNFMSNFPMPNPESIKGHSFRGWGSWNKYIDMLGGGSVTLPYTEMYMALKLGTIEGVFTGAQALEEHKLHEVVSHMVNNPLPAANSLIINRDSFKALPEDLQDLIMNESKYIITHGSLQLYQTHLYTAAHVSEEYGLKLWTWSDEDTKKVQQQCVEEIWPDFAAETPLCAELIEILKTQYRDLGWLE